jgi:uncharacterized protein
MRLVTCKLYGKRLLRLAAVVYLLLIILGIALDYLYQFRMSDSATTAYFSQRNQPIHIQYYQANGRTLRYLYSNSEPTKPNILFIHGAPSSSSYFRDYLSDSSLRSMANLFAVDRPGYGYSGLGDPEPDIAKQAAMIAPILDSLHQSKMPVVVVAASYGTSVAARLAMDFPHLVDGLVLLAPSLAPGQEKTYDISYVLESPLLWWVQPRMIHSANVEKLTHEYQLTQMLPHWKKIAMPVYYFQGQQDELIYTSNASFARKHLSQSSDLKIHMLPNLGHLIAFKAKPQITAAIGEMVEKATHFFAQRIKK